MAIEKGKILIYAKDNEGIEISEQTRSAIIMTDGGKVLLRGRPIDLGPMILAMLCNLWTAMNGEDVLHRSISAFIDTVICDKPLPADMPKVLKEAMDDVKKLLRSSLKK